MIINSSIARDIRRSAPDNELASEYLFSVEQYFTRSSKILAGILMNKLTSMKYDGFTGVRKYIMKICDIVGKLNNLGMTVSENFLVQFVHNFFSCQFKIYYIYKESRSMNELISRYVQEEERLK